MSNKIFDGKLMKFIGVIALCFVVFEAAIVIQVMSYDNFSEIKIEPIETTQVLSTMRYIGDYGLPSDDNIEFIEHRFSRVLVGKTLYIELDFKNCIVDNVYVYERLIWAISNDIPENELGQDLTRYGKVNNFTCEILSSDYIVLIAVRPMAFTGEDRIPYDYYATANITIIE